MHTNTRRSNRWAGLSSSWVAGITHRLTKRTTPAQPQTHPHNRIPRRVLLLTIGVTLALLTLTTTPALATPEWGVTVEHHNNYGLHRTECPGEHESLPGEPDCGVDPFTGSGTTFSKESGFNTYTITVKNIGNEPSGEGVVVADQIPPGLVVAGRQFGELGETTGEGWHCAVAEGAGAVTCGSESPSVEPGESYPPIEVRTHVDPDAGSLVTNVVSVSGGGAATVSVTDPTRITEAVPFGVDTFTTSVVDALASPFTEAAGHPFAASTELVFNYTPGSGGELGNAQGGPKSVEVALPAGFTGDPEAGPQCNLSLFAKSACPPGDAVGYTQVSAIGGIKSGQPRIFPRLSESSSSLVYNLAVTPGHPTEFGFEVAHAPYVLYAHVRSDGDYGVTVGDEALPNGPKLFATRLTFCGNGATEIHHGLLVSPEFSCDPVSSQSQAFLTAPAHCSSVAPVTTVQAAAWNEPADVASKAVPTGVKLVEEAPSESESFVTDCANPELRTAFNATGIMLTPQTTKADSPTGIGFDLSLPQNDEASKPATPELRDASVTLPAGMTVSPSAAEGLQGCTSAQIGLHSLSAGSCPAGSQVGTMEVLTPLLSASPRIEGIPAEGANLICASGMWNGNPGLSYQWLRGGVVIVGAIGREYHVQAADAGEPLQCQVSASNADGSSVAMSRELVIEPEPASAPALSQTPIPAPAGSTSPGGVLRCATGAWAGSPAFAYRWLRGGVPIVGAEAVEYTLTGEDAGEAVQCEVVASNAGGSVVGDSAAVVVSPSPSPQLPLLGAPLQGKVFIGTPECSPCSSQDAQEGHIFRLFLEAEAPERGVIVKLEGHVSANPSTGQVTATFKENPQLPFEDLKLAFKNGPQAPLATPQVCGEAKTTSDLTPWSSEPGIHEAEGTPDAFPSSSFNVDWDGHGGACPLSLPFNPSFLGQTSSAVAGAFTSFMVDLVRADREQDLSGVTVDLPSGLLGMVSRVSQCGEPQAANGSCPESSRIGTTTVGAGPGSHPFYVSGPVYLTGPYKGAPFGLSIAVPAVAGPFNLGTVIVRAAIAVDPITAALTVTTDPLPQLVDGVPLRLRRVTVNIDRPNFMFNPDNCEAKQISATIAGSQGATGAVSSPFAVGGCGNLPFGPTISLSTSGKTSKMDGAGLYVKIVDRPGDAVAGKVKVVLPKALPARLTTLQKACTEAQFNANPAGCPAGSVVGYARSSTPLLSSEVSGPGFLVSHGGAAFPELVFVLQGEGVMVDLHGETQIKNGITSSSFANIPDVPLNFFEATFPEGPHSILAANGNLCESKLIAPNTFVGENGAVIHRSTALTVNNCPKSKTLTRAQKLAIALKACRKKKNKHKRALCERQARKKYGPIKQAKKTNRKGR